MTGFGDATSDEDADPKGTRLVAIGRVVVEGRGIRAQERCLLVVGLGNMYSLI